MSNDDLADRVDELEDRLNGVLSVAQSALQRVNELEAENNELREQLERQEYRIGELDLCLPRATDDYKSLSTDEKVSRVRKELMDRAAASFNDRAKMDYSAVMWSVFDGKPSADHCYKLMKLAAEDTPGIEFVDPADGNKHVRIDLSTVLDETKAQSGFSHANKDTEEGAR